VGVNVPKLVASPLYARLEARRGERFAADLADFIARTGVDPRRDLRYLVGASGADPGARSGVMIAVGSFDTAGITAYVQSRTTPVRREYRSTPLLVVEGPRGRERGIALLGDQEVGDVAAVEAMHDVRAGSAPGVRTNATLGPLLDALDPNEMFWFAGDATGLLSRVPQDPDLGVSAATVRDVVGTFNVTDAVVGRLTLTATDEEAARQLADAARGVMALGQLARGQDERLAELMRGVTVVQEQNRIRVSVSIPLDLLEQLEKAPRAPRRMGPRRMRV
jgi:hypothetical protein